MQQISILNHFKFQKLKNVNDINKAKELALEKLPSKSIQPRQTNSILEASDTSVVNKRARKDNSIEVENKSNVLSRKKKKKEKNSLFKNDDYEVNCQNIVIDEDDIELKKKKYEDFQKLFERNPSNESEKTCTSTKKKASIINNAKEDQEILVHNLNIHTSDNDNEFKVKDNFEYTIPPSPSNNQIQSNFHSKDIKDNIDLQESNKITKGFALSKSTQSIIESTLNKIKQEKLKKKDADNLKSQNNKNVLSEILPIMPGKEVAPKPDISQRATEVSAKTLDIINKLKSSKEERKNRFEREKTTVRTNSESSFSLRFKYEDLISTERELILPPKYKALNRSFEQLENTMNFYQNKGKQPNFDEIKSSIENTYRQ